MGAAGDAEKIKKGDAGAHAEYFMQLPAWLKGPVPVAEADDNSDADTTENDTTDTVQAA